MARRLRDTIAEFKALDNKLGGYHPLPTISSNAQTTAPKTQLVLHQYTKLGDIRTNSSRTVRFRDSIQSAPKEHKEARESKDSTTNHIRHNTVTHKQTTGGKIMLKPSAPTAPKNARQQKFSESCRNTPIPRSISAYNAEFHRKKSKVALFSTKKEAEDRQGELNYKTETEIRFHQSNCPQQVKEGYSIYCM